MQPIKKKSANDNGSDANQIPKESESAIDCAVKQTQTKSGS